MLWFRKGKRCIKKCFKPCFNPSSQCAPVFLTPTKPSMEFFNFTMQLRIKRFGISWKNHLLGFQNLLFLNMAGKCHKHASFRIENLFFEDYFFWILMIYGFPGWFGQWLIHKGKKVHGTFGLGWKYQGYTVRFDVVVSGSEHFSGCLGSIVIINIQALACNVWPGLFRWNM